MKTGLSNQFNSDMHKLLMDIQNGKFDVKKNMAANMPKNKVSPTESIYAMKGLVFESGTAPKREIIKVSDDITEKMKEDARADFIKNNGKSTGQTRTDLAKKYLATIPEKDRRNAAWTLDRIWAGEMARIKTYFYNEVPGYKPGQKVDTKIMDQICNNNLDVSV